jgi:twitching motility two-component system response regulator PilH
MPDAVVLDIEMPGMNGFEVSVQLSRDNQTAHIPIIMFTSHDNTTALQKGMLLGAIDFIPKDIFADAVLIETLRQLSILDREGGSDDH